MAMTIAGMAAAIEAQFSVPVANPAQFSLALATAIVQYIQTNAIVPSLGLISAAPGSPVTGATTVT